MERTGAPDIFSLLRIYRLRWSGHVCRMEDGQFPKDILYVWATTLCFPTCRSPHTPLQGRTKKRFEGTQHKYGKLKTIDTGAWSLALPLQDRRAYSIQAYITDCNHRRTDRRTRRERP